MDCFPKHTPPPTPPEEDKHVAVVSTKAVRSAVDKFGTAELAQDGKTVRVRLHGRREPGDSE